MDTSPDTTSTRVRVDTLSTDTQMGALRAIVHHVDCAGIPPTVRELATILGLRSHRSAARLCEALVRRGHLERIAPRVARALVPTAAGRAALARWGG